MDDDLELDPGELVLLEQDGGVWLKEGRGETRLDSLILTNQNLVLVTFKSAGLFKRTRLMSCCPLDKLVLSDGVPQVVARKDDGQWWLQAAFRSETVSLRFDDHPRRDAQRWAQAMAHAAVGDAASACAAGALPDPDDGATGIAGAVGEVAGAFIGSMLESVGVNLPGPAPVRVPAPAPRVKEPPRKKASAKKPRMVACKCQGCHAPLSGVEGSIVVCPYCDTRQTLRDE